MDRENAIRTGIGIHDLQTAQALDDFEQHLAELEAANPGQYITWHLRRDGHLRIIVSDDDNTVRAVRGEE